jgi:hypothetical protein
VCVYLSSSRRLSDSYYLTVTTQIEIYQCNDVELGSFWLVDTPGFNDTNLTEVEVLQRIAVWLDRAYRQHIALTGLLYLHSITQPRASGSIVNSFTWFRQICGQRAFRKVSLVTTFWDKVPEVLSAGDAVNRETQYKGTEYWGSMIDMGAGLERHDDTVDSARNIVRNAILRRTNDDPDTFLLFQMEIGREHRRLDDTSVGRNMSEYQERQQQTFTVELDRIGRELRQQMEALDEQHRRELEDRWARFEQERARIREQQRLLQTDVETLNRNFERLEREATERRDTELRAREDALARQLRLEREIRQVERLQQEHRENAEARRAFDQRLRREQQYEHNFWHLAGCPSTCPARRR